MRVCIVALDFLPFRSSGLSVYAENLVIGLRERGHHVSVVAARRTQGDNVPLESSAQQIANRVYRLPVGKLDWFALSLLSSLWLLRNRHNFDVVHFSDLHFSFAYPGSCVSSAFHSFRQRMKSNRGLPYFVGHSDLVFKLAYYTLARLIAEPIALHRSSLILMSSHATMHEFVQHYHVDPSKAVVIYPGISLAPFSSLPKKEDARHALGLPRSKKILLFVGFGGPRKGLEHLLGALEMFQGEVMLLLVGNWNQSFLRLFKSKAAQKGLADKVMITGYVPERQKRLYYAAADVFVFPSLLEGFGIPLAEAMASGLPIVTTTGGAASEIVDNAGLCVPPGDHLALYEAISTLLDDYNLRVKLSNAGIERAVSLFDLRKMAQRVEDVYKDVAHVE